MIYMYSIHIRNADIVLICVYLYNICVASLQNSPLVGRNESGIIPD